MAYRSSPLVAKLDVRVHRDDLRRHPTVGSIRPV